MGTQAPNGIALGVVDPVVCVLDEYHALTAKYPESMITLLNAQQMNAVCALQGIVRRCGVPYLELPIAVLRRVPEPRLPARGLHHLQQHVIQCHLMGRHALKRRNRALASLAPLRAPRVSVNRTTPCASHSRRRPAVNRAGPL
ncbi:hypothetical protein [Alicyclobacillus hesperidum]|uniref:hypothetical protein n=1 Tax=Alicyclobacillus hesperidum TaxID=89784 RepID=UPI0012FD4560|nr:hypothetical protein [Alicyclobacillus hesperidum]